MKKLFDKLMLWLGYVPLETFKKQHQLVASQAIKINELLTEKMGSGFGGMFFGKQFVHEPKDFYNDVHFRINGCMHCSPHLLQCHAKHELTDDIVTTLEAIRGIEKAALNGKYTVEFLKGIHFSWDDLMKDVVPVIKIYLNYPVDKINA